MALKKVEFPKKQEGDILGASHVNDLSDAVQCLSSGLGGSFNMGDGCNTSNFAPFIQIPVVVITEGCEGDADLYEVQPLYYDFDTNEWKTNETGTKYCLDPTAFDLTFSVDDRLVAWWDSQRSMFLPIASGNACTEIHFTILSADCAAKTALVQIDSRTCGCSSSPEEDEYEQVTVHDTMGCHLDEPNADLVDRKGAATYMQLDYDGECQWEIDDICCDPNICLP